MDVIRIKSKNKILLLSLIALVLTVFFFWNLQPAEVPFVVSLQSGSQTERIKPWKDEQGEWYVFLPGYAQMENLRVKLNTDTDVLVNGIPLFDDMSCHELACGIPYDMEYAVFGSKNKTQITFLRSSAVAAMFLDTASGDMGYVHEKKGNEENGAVRLYTEHGTVDCVTDSLTIKGRGNVTWTASEKKPYTITLEQGADLLRMGKAQKWILLANSYDYAHLRNKLVYDFAAEIGLPYSPQSRWVDLYLNGAYAGLYLLSEKNEVHPERVDIDPDGSFLVSMDRKMRLKEQNIPYIQTNSQTTFRIHYPENPDERTMERIKERLQRVENAILSGDGMDPVSGKHFSQLADLDSWVRNYLIDEISGNLDGFEASKYFYFDASGNQKIYAGPVWDFDHSLGNDTDPVWSVTNPNVQMLQRYAYDLQIGYVWVQALYERLWFREQMIAVFEKEMLSEIKELLDTKIGAYAEQIRSAVWMDSIRWSIEQEGGYDQAVSQVSEYLEAHTAFLKSAWVDGEQYCQLSFLRDGCNQFYCVPYGGRLEELPVANKREKETFVGWYYADTGEPFDITKPVTEDIQLHAKWVDKPAKKIDQLIQLLPLGVIAVMGCGLLVAEIRKNRR